MKIVTQANHSRWVQRMAIVDDIGYAERVLNVYLSQDKQEVFLRIDEDGNVFRIRISLDELLLAIAQLGEE